MLELFQSNLFCCLESCNPVQDTPRSSICRSKLWNLTTNMFMVLLLCNKWWRYHKRWRRLNQKNWKSGSINWHLHKIRKFMLVSHSLMKLLQCTSRISSQFTRCLEMSQRTTSKFLRILSSEMKLNGTVLLLVLLLVSQTRGFIFQLRKSTF